MTLRHGEPASTFRLPSTGPGDRVVEPWALDRTQGCRLRDASVIEPGMGTNKRIIAATELMLIFPAGLFLTVVVPRDR